MTDEQIKHMVQRFLGWSLPENFNPDAGISFEPVVNKGTSYEHRHNPVGTNLLDATQAEAMVRHMVEGLAASPVPEELRELSEKATEGKWGFEGPLRPGNTYRIRAPAGLITYVGDPVTMTHDRANTAFIVACVNFVRHSLAARPSAEGVGEDPWRSMSDAPRDGSEILICNDRGQFVVMFDDTWGSTGDEEGGWWMVSDGKNLERPLRGDGPYGWKPLGQPLAALNKGSNHG